MVRDGDPRHGHLPGGRLVRLAVQLAVLAAVFFGAAAPARDDLPNTRTVDVEIGGEGFRLEIADTPDQRVRGLSGRATLAERGGMLFAFPSNDRRERSFVMRDCALPLDLVFLDEEGRVVALHEMEPEPRLPGEGRPGEYVARYEERLTRYSSGEPVQFAIELRGGTVRRLGVAVGDRLRFPRQALAAEAN